tara:strand:+ start:7512 stop:7916 length:405 start_codon:yes stop_codon:yes gene_type:complete
MQEYYFDTSIWIDIHEKRGNNGKIANRLFRKIIKEDSIILYSHLTLLELRRNGYSHDEIMNILSISKPNNLKRVHIYKEQLEEARKLCKVNDIPKGDILHAILSRDNDGILVSRDWDFQLVRHISKVKLPEDLV